MYATAKNAAIYWGMGIPEHSHGTASAMALIHLALLTGHIGREGTGLNPLRGQNNVQGASDGRHAVPLSRLQRVDNEEAARKWEQAWNIEPGGLSRKLRADHHRDPERGRARAGCARCTSWARTR